MLGPADPFNTLVPSDPLIVVSSFATLLYCRHTASSSFADFRSTLRSSFNNQLSRVLNNGIISKLPTINSTLERSAPASDPRRRRPPSSNSTSLRRSAKERLLFHHPAWIITSIYPAESSSFCRGQKTRWHSKKERLRAMTTSMSPQSIGPRSNESLATTQSPNTTPTTTRSKRTNDSLDELDYDSSGSDIDWNNDNGKKTLAAIESKFNKILAPYNKRSKHSHVVPIFTIQNTQSIILGGTNNHTQSAHGCGIGGTSQSCAQATQAQQDLQAPRPTLSSTSTLQSNLSSLFSSQERPQDTQSEFSQAPSTSTSCLGSGKGCKTCLKHLTNGYPSEFKNHFWPTHYPQELFYCLFCKCGVIDKNGLLFWQCKKCHMVHDCEMDAVTHFSNRHLSCYQRKGHWKRSQPWKEHVQAHLQAECFVDISSDPEKYLRQCIYCQETFSHVSDSKKHSCPFTTWNSKMPAPLPSCCEEHPGADFSTYDKINEHFENVHFGKSKAGSTKSKQHNKSQVGSVQGDHESRHGNDAHTLGQQDHGVAPKASDPTIDLQGGLGQGPNLQTPHYPQGLTLGDEGGASQRSLRSRTLAPKRTLHPEPEEPPVYADIVTNDGRPNFLTRSKP